MDYFRAECEWLPLIHTKRWTLKNWKQCQQHIIFLFLGLSFVFTPHFFIMLCILYYYYLFKLVFSYIYISIYIFFRAAAFVVNNFVVFALIKKRIRFIFARSVWRVRFTLHYLSSLTKWKNEIPGTTVESDRTGSWFTWDRIETKQKTNEPDMDPLLSTPINFCIRIRHSIRSVEVESMENNTFWQANRNRYVLWINLLWHQSSESVLPRSFSLCEPSRFQWPLATTRTNKISCQNIGRKINTLLHMNLPSHHISIFRSTYDYVNITRIKKIWTVPSPVPCLR